MHRNVLAVVLALASQAAWAEPYRTLPRLPPSRVKARAAAAHTAERVAARDASAPAIEPAALQSTSGGTPARIAEPPTASAPVGTPVSTPTPTPPATATITPTATATPTTTPTVPTSVADVIVMPPPAASRPGEGPLVLEVLPTYDEPSPPASLASSSPASLVGAPSEGDELTTIRETRQPDGHTLQLVRGRSGALLEILRDAEGRLLSARDARP